jgi:signal transduction histidine kinase
VDEIKGLLKKGQQIKISYEGTRLVAADKKLLKNVMINLITNAIKFSDEGQEIDIITRANTETAMISVEDHGIGISEEDLEHLFTSFFRGTNATNIQGTGLGLHIVKRYLNLMGGTADITTVLDQGTTVSITIPTNKPII